MQDRAAQLRQSIVSTRAQVDEIRQLFDSIHFGGTPALCKATAEKLHAWWEGIVMPTDNLLAQWPKVPGAEKVLCDVFYDVALHEIDCRINMVLGALAGMQHDGFDEMLYEDISSSGPVALEEAWKDLLSGTETFIASLDPPTVTAEEASSADDRVAQLEDVLRPHIEKKRLVAWLIYSLDYFGSVPPAASKIVSEFVHEWFWALYNDVDKALKGPVSPGGGDMWSEFCGGVLSEASGYCSNLELAIVGLTQLEEEMPDETAWCMSQDFDEWFKRFLTQARSFMAERRAA